MPEKVLITAASGLIGSRLTPLLISRGYEVNVLGRKRVNEAVPHISSFTWDLANGSLDKAAFEGVSAVIHLAGAGVAEMRWTEDRKKEIINSRVKTAGLIYECLKTGNHTVRTFISASAVGYYGDCGGEIVKEERKPGEGFLAEVCKQWEHMAEQIGELGVREVRGRIGVVLAKYGGALPELTKTIPFGFASYFYKKNLYYPWVHIDDVCGIMIHALEHQNVKGPYNTTAPGPLQMKDLMHEIVSAKKSGAVLLPVPPGVIKLGLGEMSEMLLGSQRCTAEKIIASGYNFRYSAIENTLRNIF